MEFGAGIGAGRGGVERRAFADGFGDDGAGQGRISSPIRGRDGSKFIKNKVSSM